MSVEVRAQNTLSMTSVKAIKDATDEATTLLDGMRQSALEAGTTLNGIYQDAEDAKTNAEQAQVSATQASEYASRALGNLASVQSVTETLNWITAHGTMTKTTDTALDPTHVYFVRDANGDYVVGNYHYSVVSEPSTADLSDYYELSINESLNNYVATHLAVDSEGLWILPDSGGNKVLIATGQGSTYTTAGTYIIGDNNTVLAGFGEETFIGNSASGQIRVNSTSIIGNIDETRMFSLDLSGGTVDVSKYINYNQEDLPMTASHTVTIPSDITFTAFQPMLEAPDHRGASSTSMFTYGTSATKLWYSPSYSYRATIQYDGDRTITIGSWTPSDATYTFSGIWYKAQGNGPAYTFGTRDAEVGAGGYSMGIGDDVKATAYCSYAEGYGTEANTTYAHAEGYNTVAHGSASHAEGSGTKANGQDAHAEGDHTTANGNYSHAEGSYAVTHDRGAHAEGYGTIARGQYSHAQNLSTEARHKAQTVIGTYNVVEYTEPSVAVHPSGDKSYGRYALAVGNGIDASNSSNAFTIDWAGNTVASGTATSTDMTQQEVDDFVDSLQVGGGNVAVDLVVEEGISGIWTYRKWSSGIAECWGTTAGASHAITSPYGYGYWVHENYTLPSGLFTSVTSAQANRSGGDGLVYISIDSVSINGIGCYIADFVSHTVSFSISFSVKGRWK